VSTPRTVTSWDLSHGGRRLSIYWTDEHGHHTGILESDTQIEPWQVSGALAAVRSGAQLDSIGLPETRPAVSAGRRALGKVATVLFDALDRATRGRSMAGGAA
jgi:hypothetical protein